MSSTAHAGQIDQPSFDDLGQPLFDVTFVVVDLETTGSTAEDSITEIGAVKVRAGEVVGEFQTLVNPNGHIPALVAVLTGITNQMVASAPRLAQVLPSFLEFATGSVLVAHNAGFDVGFLRRACTEHEHPWPDFGVLDTVKLSRSILLRDEVPNHKLGTLARHFRATTTPNHRALSDARATVDVLHGLMERVGSLGVQTLEDLSEFSRRVSPERRAKRTWAADLPQQPGVYLFKAGEEVLYVGKSTNLRTRVRSYFTASEHRSRIDEMVRVATGVEPVVCETPLQAEVCELRLIATHQPRYNRRSKFPHRQQWLKITIEPLPRLSVVRQVKDDDATYFGPFRRRQQAEEVALALYDAFPIRQCTPRLSPKRSVSPCALAGMGRCCAPCDGSTDADAYAAVVESVRDCLTHDVRPVVGAVRRRLRRLIAQQRFEEAASIRSRLETVLATSLRFHRVRALADCAEVVGAVRDAGGDWEIHVVRYGRLAGAARARRGENPLTVADACVATAETVRPAPGPLPAATVEETERVADWLERPGVRLIDVTGDWAWPVHAGLDGPGLIKHALGDIS
ncbi:MAG: DEDD exonuclease domain-containing protein [Propionibacteriaceae bacterium]